MISNSNICSKNCVKTLKKKKKVSKRIRINKENRENEVAEELKKYGYSYLQNNSNLMKYWKKRHLLFSKFEKGIQLDEGIIKSNVFYIKN